VIVFIEDRKMVVDCYKHRFEKAGETIVQLTASDLMIWVTTSELSELATVEAILVGECADPQKVIDTIRSRLEVPIVAMLDNRSLEQTISFYRKGVDDVVIKPVHFEELLVRIAAIKKRSMNGISKKSKNQILVYFDGRDPELDGEQLLLPRRERRILEYLASINGRRATKSQIFGAIYGVFDEKIEENVVESHISKLRKKLSRYLGMDPIDSRRYLGYRLDPELVTVNRNAPQTLVA